MARGSPKCPNCKAPLRENDGRCQKCGIQLYFNCKRCKEWWSREKGSLCPRCGGSATD